MGSNPTLTAIAQELGPFSHSAALCLARKFTKIIEIHSIASILPRPDTKQSDGPGRLEEMHPQKIRLQSIVSKAAGHAAWTCPATGLSSFCQGRSAAIDVEDGPGDPGRLAGQQESGECGRVVRLTQALQRMAFGNPFPHRVALGHR